MTANVCTQRTVSGIFYTSGVWAGWLCAAASLLAALEMARQASRMHKPCPAHNRPAGQAHNPMLQRRVKVALVWAQACLLHSAMLLTNVAMLDAPQKHLRLACLELLPAILSGTGALLGPRPGADAEAVVECHHVLACKILVSALPRNRQGLRHFFVSLRRQWRWGARFVPCPSKKETLQCLALWPPGTRAVLCCMRGTVVTLLSRLCPSMSACEVCLPKRPVCPQGLSSPQKRLAFSCTGNTQSVLVGLIQVRHLAVWLSPPCCRPCLNERCQVTKV